jgi:SWI/SNF-related matrix-associated actin-dependent regulator of chromatin subfamily A member 5
MDWDSIQLLGENLPEFELLNFGPIEQAFWIKCEHCVHRHQHDLEAKALCDTMEKEWLDALAKRPELVMEGTTVEGSEVATPIDVEELVDSPMISPFEPAREGKKRRRKQVDYTPKRNVKKQKVKAEVKAEIAGLLTAPPQESISPLPPQEPLVNA